MILRGWLPVVSLISHFEHSTATSNAPTCSYISSNTLLCFFSCISKTYFPASFTFQSLESKNKEWDWFNEEFHCESNGWYCASLSFQLRIWIYKHFDDDSFAEFAFLDIFSIIMLNGSMQRNNARIFDSFVWFGIYIRLLHKPLNSLVISAQKNFSWYIFRIVQNWLIFSFIYTCKFSFEPLKLSGWHRNHKCQQRHVRIKWLENMKIGQCVYRPK